MYVSADWHMDVAGMDQSCLHEGLPAVPGGLPLLAVHAAVDGVMLLLMLATNASIVAAIVRQRRRLAGVSLSARFAANLAAADAFVGAATVFYLSYRYVCASRVGLGGYKYTCVLRFVVVSSAHMTSAYSLVAIAVDRYIAVVHALRYKEIMNVRRWAVIIATVWLASIMINLSLFAWNKWEPGAECELDKIVPLGYMIAAGIATHGGIIVVVALVHYRIHREAVAVKCRRLTGDNQPCPGGSAANVLRRTMNTKSARVLLLVTCVYLGCWAPYTLLYLVKVSGISSPAIDLAQNLAYTFANINYLVNPFIYSWKNANVRQCIVRTLQDLGLYDKSVLSNAVKGNVSDRRTSSRTPSSEQIIPT
ncbi:adenosine receptor A1-like isoform X1 [Schistocerca gregaria]|uniref:adenosine receptor A1-like isoform X1 n=3 Tax=Schistocerca gregaria TaxID=7010 RepID=UPI00211E8860|nr:adenosine receptor A1-like isoform X1 [Schistocerca gregaria]